MSLGDKIRNRRNQLGMTQDDLAMALKVKRQTIHKYESGITTNLPLGRVQELADALDVSPAYLMGWNEKKPADSEWNSELEKENFRLFKALNPDQQRLEMHEKVFYNTFYETLKRAGVRKLNPHCCRHTFATLMANKGIQPAVITETAGHEDYSTTLQYTHISLDEKLKAVNSLK